MEHFYIFCSPREQGSPKGLGCGVLAQLTLAHVLLSGFLPGVRVHSITLVFHKQVSHCSQKVMPGSPHLAAGNRISKSDLTTEVLVGKGSSPAPSSPVYQRLLPASTSSTVFHSAHFAPSSSSSLALPSTTLQELQESAQRRRGEELCDRYATTAPPIWYTGTGCPGKRPCIFNRELVI